MQAAGGRQRIKNRPGRGAGAAFDSMVCRGRGKYAGVYSAGSAATAAVLPESRRTVSRTDS